MTAGARQLPKTFTGVRTAPITLSTASNSGSVALRITKFDLGMPATPSAAIFNVNKINHVCGSESGMRAAWATKSTPIISWMLLPARLRLKPSGITIPSSSRRTPKRSMPSMAVGKVALAVVAKAVPRASRVHSIKL